MSINNKREYFRVNLQIPLSALLKIIGVEKKMTNTKFSKIIITDISAGGIRIHSKLDLPVHMNLLLEFNFQLFNNELKLLGTIARKNEISKGLFEYGIQFHLDMTKEQQLASYTNLLNARLRKARVLTNCSFCSDEELKEFYPDNGIELSM